MRTYSELAGPNVPRLQRERRDKLLIWLVGQGPMTINEILLSARSVYPTEDLYRHDGIARKDLKQLERYGLVRCIGHPNKWRAI